MIFKIGAKLKFKSSITKQTHEKIGVYIKGNEPMIKHSNLSRSHYSNRDIQVKFGQNGDINMRVYVVPEEWFELAQRPGHHLTKIFK